MDREGFRVVPEATPLVDEEAAQPAEHGALTKKASGDQVPTAAGARAALLTGAAACLVAAGIASRVHTPPHPDAALTDLATA